MFTLRTDTVRHENFLRALWEVLYRPEFEDSARGIIALLNREDLRRAKVKKD